MSHLNGVLDLLLEVARDVVAVSNVPDPRQRHTGSKGLREARQPTQGKSLVFCVLVSLHLQGGVCSEMRDAFNDAMHKKMFA